jgi:hypothetical protein
VKSRGSVFFVATTTTELRPESGLKPGVEPGVKSGSGFLGRVLLVRSGEVEAERDKLPISFTGAVIYGAPGGT